MKLHHPGGAGLIEVLIAIVITAFSLMGLAGLQMAALRYQKVAHYRAIAATYSHNLAERVRANIQGARAGYYSPALQNYPPANGDVPQAPGCAISSSCTHAEIAALDIYEWRTALANAMAGGWGEISGSVAKGFAVSVYFREPGNRTESEANDSESVLNKTQCRTAALNAATDQDVRCFTTIFVP
ncbi:type IV pilus modification protein PilV [Glaciimonas sp. CA11.2]|uniref:type IV pilus modification protein PilV n=1 Tax=Glaciimonas sp. CA11.2 TaxID=3048601 RepID=UPI002AB5938C|nr:type IV pilus modification protein PilV [Glaciimonas sp. CA11.2]MDY7546016.1 type IV pilus modification protein PilV [Glaciimonas sp. CA11.2]MEB0164184.1 type IV pilus modification protein PilV [Glaciimonas sp. CA11.2]